ncbi:hypothetical protein TWF696_004707 [Orbilia brochopaga]|uniref:SCP domain-containing protein n=1 Tax=Orbilia brochopaga TaxID=3140254 RepID=A0AAV9V1S3_9PEZI
MHLMKASFTILLLSTASAFPLTKENAVGVTLGSSRASSVEAHIGVTADNNPVPLGWQKSVLDYHNGYRAHHQVAPLRWNDTLAKAAQQSASRCDFALTPNNPYGENIAAGTYSNPDYYVYMWYNASLKYDYHNPGFSYTTGTFTQVVWKDTTQLGCGWVDYCRNGWPKMLFCEYSPAGNILPNSNFATQVLRPVANPPAPSPPPMIL